ncbi:MAG: glycosyltransferase [Krumholzibacteria bacterium]|nr:glycosyltransferase [Candidatus Krumholzibacteria bacterium]
MADTPTTRARLPRTAIVYHYFAHYRLPVLRTLTAAWEERGSRLTVVSDRAANQPALTTITPALADVPLAQGGLRWRFVTNRWLLRNVLWQSGVLRLALGTEQRVLILLGNPYFISTWVAAILARLRGKRVLFWTHGVTRREHGLQKLLRFSFLRLAHGLLLYGNWARDQLVRTGGFDPAKLHVIFNSLDHDVQVQGRALLVPERLDRVRREFFGAQPELPLLVFCGRLVARKRIDLVLEAAHRLQKDGRPVNVLVVGDGPLQQHLKKLAADLDLKDRVAFAGACYDEARLAMLLGAADLCVAPDGLGLLAIHALTYGTPVVTHGNVEHHFPEYEAVVPGLNGAIFREGDPRDLADVIAAWLEAAPDRRQVREACFEVVDRWYNPAAQVERIVRAVRGEPAQEERVLPELERPESLLEVDRLGTGGPGGALSPQAQPPVRGLVRRLGRRARMLTTPARYKLIATGKDFHMGQGCRVMRRCVRVGDYSFIGNDCHLMSRLRIGNWVMFASQVSVVGGDHDFVIPGVPAIWAGRGRNREVVVEDDVWVGHGVTILHGAHIGEGAIIAAGALVTQDVEPYTIVGGVPARLLRRRFLPEEEAAHRRALAELRARYCGG